VTQNAANALRLEGYGVAPGCRVDPNILAVRHGQHVLRLQQPPVDHPRRVTFSHATGSRR
jgi:hypothetical protein